MWIDEVPHGEAMRRFYEHHVAGPAGFFPYEVFLQPPPEPFVVSQARGYFLSGKLRYDPAIPFLLKRYGSAAVAELYALDRPEGCMLVEVRLQMPDEHNAWIAFDDRGGLTVRLENSESAPSWERRAILKGGLPPASRTTYASVAEHIPRMRRDLLETLERYRTPARRDARAA